MKIWRDIPGWCDFEWLYEEMVKQARHGAIFVEIGAWVGRSACLMGDLIRSSEKEVLFYAVDHGLGSPELANEMQEIVGRGSTQWEELVCNIADCALGHYIQPIRAKSVDAAMLFRPHSVDFAFIDGNHEEESVVADVAAWLPTMRHGGTLAGHDWELESVRRGVFTHITPEPRGTCWVYEVP